LESELDEVQRLAKIVDGLTLLTKADAGQIKLAREPVRLDELVREAWADAQSLARPREVQVSLTACEELTVTGDRHRLRQLLLNLTDNAIKYNETGGIVDMERSIRFAAADWRDADKPNRDKLATAIAGVLTRTLGAKSSSSAWNANTGTLKLTFKRPSQLYPPLELTETVEITALVAADKPGGSDRLMLWIGNPVISTADESGGAKLNLADDSGGDEEAEQKDDNGSVDALAREFKGQRWDSDKSAWK